jgi:hypothetical protein
LAEIVGSGVYTLRGFNADGVDIFTGYVPNQGLTVAAADFESTET